MMFGKLVHLDETTKNAISKEQQRLHSGEIPEPEYENRYEAIMSNFRVETARILEEGRRYNF